MQIYRLSKEWTAWGISTRGGCASWVLQGWRWDLAFGHELLGNVSSQLAWEVETGKACSSSLDAMQTRERPCSPGLMSLMQTGGHQQLTTREKRLLGQGCRVVLGLMVRCWRRSTFSW